MKIVEILRAVSLAYKEFKNAFKYGQTTDELFLFFEESLKNSLGEYEIIYDYIWGKDSLNIDGVTKNYIPQKGDTLIMDISVKKDGVWCDVCRTFFVGGISEGQRSVFQMIERSLRAGQAALKAGASACDIYTAVNAVYQEKGKTLVHHAGHKIEDVPVAQPQFLTGNEMLLICGDVYAIESGLYEDFGVRLENDYLIKENGAEDLFEELLPLKIEEYIVG